MADDDAALASPAPLGSSGASTQAGSSSAVDVQQCPLCNGPAGECTCEMMYSPYQNDREYHAWEGEDCSYLWAYCAACRSAPFRALAAVVAAAAAYLLAASSPTD